MSFLNVLLVVKTLAIEVAPLESQVMCSTSSEVLCAKLAATALAPLSPSTTLV